MANYKPADWGGDVDDLPNTAGEPLFKRLVLNWSPPQVVEKGEKPRFDDPRPLLYAIVRNHHKSQQKDKICYIGLSTNPARRFYNHPTARDLIERRGETSLSFANLDLQKSSDKIHVIKRALEDVEHILIWALWQNLENKAKLYTLPGMGSTTGDPYHIINEGYRFVGQMPKEIVYPWMLVKIAPTSHGNETLSPVIGHDSEVALKSRCPQRWRNRTHMTPSAVNPSITFKGNTVLGVGGPPSAMQGFEGTLLRERLIPYSLRQDFKFTVDRGPKSELTPNG